MSEDPEIASVIDALRTDAEKRFFFEKATKPAWLHSILARGYFSTPPDVRRLDNSLQFVPWPAADYLGRVASIADPSDVVAAIASVPASDNAAIYPSLMRAVLALPAEASVYAAEQVGRWMRISFAARFIHDDVAEFVIKLASAGYKDEAVSLARSTLGFAEPRPPREVEVNEQKVPMRGEPVSYLDAWAFDRFLEGVVPALVQVSPISTVTMLADLLDAALYAEFGEDGRKKHRDLSYVWRREIEGDAEEQAYEYKQALVTQLYAAAMAAAGTPGLSPRQIVEQLRQYPWPIHSRIALLVALSSSESDFDLGRDLVLEKELFDLPEYRPEYSAILATIFTRLDDDERAQILSWIQEGPDPEAERDRRSVWQRNRLAPIRGHLPKVWLDHYDELVEQYGQPDWQASYVIGPTQFWSGPTSPLDATQIRSMPVTDLLEFLRSWQPSGEFQSPSREGLARLVAADIPDRVLDYVRNAETFAELDPIYTTHFLSGLRSTADSLKVIDLDPVLRLADRIVAGHVATPVRQSAGFDVDELYEWPAARRELAHLLERLCRTDALSWEQDATCWLCIEVLLRDDDPTPADEERFGATMGAVDYSINCTRGQATHAACAFLCHLARAGRTEGAIRARAEQALEERLDPAREPSAAVRAAIAMNLRSFPFVDQVWATGVAPRILTDDSLGRVAWAAALRFGGLPQTLLPAIWPILDRALHNPDWQKDAGTLPPTLQLAVELYVAGYETPLDLIEGIRTAWSLATIEARSHLLIALGNRVSSDQVPPGTIARVAEVIDLFLNEAVRAGVRPVGRQRDLEAIGWVLAKGSFPIEWTLSTFEKVLELGVLPMDPEDVITLMAEAVERDDLHDRILSALERLIELDTERWTVYVARVPIVTILRIGKASRIEQTRARSLELESRLLAAGRLHPDWLR